MSYTVQTLLNDIASTIHGTSVSKVPNIYGIINRAARAVLLDVDPKETQRIVQLSQVFSDVYDYPIPGDVKGDRIIDIRPQSGRTVSEQFSQWYSNNFDVTKGFNTGNKIYTQWNTGVKTIRIDAPFLTEPLTLTDTSSTSGWTGTNISNISVDQVNNVAGGGAIQFDNDASSFIIRNQSLTAVNLSTYVQVSNMFFWIYAPQGLTAVYYVLFGSSAVNSYQPVVPITTNAQGNAFQPGWNLVSVPWNNTTVTSGTPDPTAITTLYLGVTAPTQKGMKLCNVTFNLGSYLDMVYYSKYLFRDPTTNAFQESISSSLDDSKVINLDTESYNLLFNKTAFYIAQSLQGADATYDATFWLEEYNKALTRYIALNPAEALVKAAQYYDMPRKGYGSLTGRFFNR